MGRQHDDDQVGRKEHTGRRDHRASEAGDKETDECHRDDDRSRSDHGDRHGIEELPLGQPVELVDHTPMEKGYDCQTAAEHERPCLGEVPEYCPERLCRRRTLKASNEPVGRREHERGRFRTKAR